jgi:hypothetical protein
MRQRSSAKRIDSGEQTVRSKRTAAYVACASVVAACAGLAYDAVHPFFPKPEAVLTWPSPLPPSKPLLPVPRGTAEWPPDSSRAAVPFVGDIIRLLLPPDDDCDDDAGPPGSDAPTGSTTDRARAIDGPKPAEKPPAASKETTGQAGPPQSDQARKNAEVDEGVQDGRMRGRYRYYHHYRHRHHHRN